MKKNGFTIVELLASIAILAIIMTLGTVCINIVTQRVLNSNYESKKSLIELKAAEYASDTGFLFTNVDNLVKNGYLTADDKNDNIINPVTKEAMNCLIVQVHNENDNLYGILTEEKECNNDNILQTNIHLGIHVIKESNSFRTDDVWTNQNVTLELYFKDLDVSENEVTKIIWETNAFKDEREVSNDFRSKNKYSVDVSQVVDTTYYAKVILKDETVYYAKVTVKIDKQNPIIYDDEMKVSLTGPLENRQNILKVAVSDTNGSGIGGYYVGENSNCREVSYVDFEGNYFEVPVTNKIYYICVQDKVGNISEEISSKKVDLINLEPPSILNRTDNLVLGKEDYEFKNNVDVNFGIFEGTISCNPTLSKKSGNYDVTCTALSDNGLSSTTTFHVSHTP